MSKIIDMERLHGNRTYLNRVKARGVDLDDLEPAEIDKIVSNMRRDGWIADEYYGGLLDQRVRKLSAPVISVIGERDQATEYYPERFKEWEFITDTVGLVVVDEGNHYSSGTAPTRSPSDHDAVRPTPRLDTGRGPEPGWWLADVHRPRNNSARAARRRTDMRRSRRWHPASWCRCSVRR